MKQKANLISVLLLVALTLVSCGSEKISEAEIRAELPALIEKSQPLNEIYFGDGFLPSGDNESDIPNYYYCNCEKYQLFSVEQIKEATEEVFTKEYAAVLYEGAFEGLTTDSYVLSARYIEGEKGLMQSVNSEVYELPKREFDFESIKIIEADGGVALFSIESTTEGEKTEIKMIMSRYRSNEGYYYRLDSPTY